MADDNENGLGEEVSESSNPSDLRFMLDLLGDDVPDFVQRWFDEPHTLNSEERLAALGWIMETLTGLVVEVRARQEETPPDADQDDPFDTKEFPREELGGWEE